MKDFLSAYPAAAWSIVSLLVAATVIIVLWDQVKWWWMNTWYKVPVVGATASLARDPGRANEQGWRKSELKLCRDYKRFLRLRDEHDFNEKITYLTKAGDLGRRSTPVLIWLLTVALVFVEAVGFSYVLAGYTVPGASEDVQQLGALGIAFMISVLLVAFTHYAGHELYVSGKIAHARQMWNESGQAHALTSGEIALAKSQSQDDDKPPYTQLANRVGSRAKYIVTIGTAIFVIIVAIGATYVRGQVLEKTLHQHTMGLSSSSSGKGIDLGALELPAADAQSARETEAKAQNDENAIDTRGGWGTFIVLAFIFVFLQVLGVLFGFKWGFAGKESFQAYKAIGKGRYSSYADVRADAAEIIDRAQATLEGLQQRVMHRIGREEGTKGDARNTFKDFLHMERLAESRDRDSEREHAGRRLQTQRDADIARVQAPAQAQTPAVVHAPVAAAPAADDADDEIEALRQQIAAKQKMRDAEAGRLAAERAAADAVTQQRSVREAERARLRAELDRLNDEAGA